MNNIFALSAVLLLTTGCGGGGPVTAGTSWTLQTTETATRTSYWLRDGGSPVESIGHLEVHHPVFWRKHQQVSSTSTSTSETLTVNTIG